MKNGINVVSKYNIIEITSVNKNSSKKIELCPRCKGSGMIHQDSFGSGYTDMMKCTDCIGTGRVKIINACCIIQVPFDYKGDDNEN